MREIMDDDDIAIFDQFHIEEMFGAKVESLSPRTMRVLDTQDLHFLRESRRRAFDGGATLDQLCDMDFITNEIEPDDKSCRELASIHRSDLVLVTSRFEYELLTGDRFRVPKSKLAMASLFYGSDLRPPSRRKEKKHLCFIGNFRHEPNLACVRDLRDIVWPRLERLLPDGTELHCYGASANEQHLKLTRGSFKVVGYAEDQFRTLSKYRVLLAYLTFGAGVKGKIADAWLSKCAVVTTGIGRESMTTKDGDDFAGLWSNNLDEFVDMAAKAYHDGDELTERGTLALSSLYDRSTNLRELFDRLRHELEKVEQTRRHDFAARVLWSQSHRSTDHMSRYIELKQQYRDLQKKLVENERGNSSGGST